MGESNHVKLHEVIQKRLRDAGVPNPSPLIKRVLFNVLAGLVHPGVLPPPPAPNEPDAQHLELLRVWPLILDLSGAAKVIEKLRSPYHRDKTIVVHCFNEQEAKRIREIIEACDPSAATRVKFKWTFASA